MKVLDRQRTKKMAHWKDTKNVVFLYQCCGSQQTAAVVAVEIQKLFYLRMQSLRRFFLFSGFSTFFFDWIWEKQSGQWDNEDEDQERSIVNKSKMNLTCTLINVDRCWYKRCAQIQRVVIQQCVSCLCRSLARLGRLRQLDIHRLFCPLPISTHFFWLREMLKMPKRTIPLRNLVKRDMFFTSSSQGNLRQFGNEDSTVWKSQRHTDPSVLFEYLWVSSRIARH